MIYFPDSGSRNQANNQANQLTNQLTQPNQLIQAKLNQTPHLGVSVGRSPGRLVDDETISPDGHQGWDAADAQPLVEGRSPTRVGKRNCGPRHGRVIP